MAYDTFTFEIIKSFGRIAKRTADNGEEWTKEVNLVSWNGRSPKVDIREWNETHTRMGRGLALTEGEAEIVAMILHNYIAERG